MERMKSLAHVFWLAPLIVAMTACSSGPQTSTGKQPPKPPETITGRQAFQRMYPQARGWAADAQPLQIQSINLPNIKAEKGKAAAWQVIFVSASRGKSKTFTYSSVEGDLHEGVFGGIEEDYTPRGDSSPFEVAAIRIDSDQAYQTAAHMSADYIKKNPDKPVIFLMEHTPRFPDVTWRVIWGDSVGTSDYSVFVDATTGKALEEMH
jgi:hypothetical protein